MFEWFFITFSADFQGNLSWHQQKITNEKSLKQKLCKTLFWLWKDFTFCLAFTQNSRLLSYFFNIYKPRVDFYILIQISWNWNCQTYFWKSGEIVSKFSSLKLRTLAQCTHAYNSKYLAVNGAIFQGIGTNLYKWVNLTRFCTLL